MDNLVVDSKLAALIANDKDANAATAVAEGVGETVEQAALIKDGKALLDIASLGHGNHTTVVTDIQDAVLLEHRADHVLDDDGWARVAHEG